MKNKPPEQKKKKNPTQFKTPFDFKRVKQQSNLKFKVTNQRRFGKG